jgi:hypothetical protein
MTLNDLAEVPCNVELLLYRTHHKPGALAECMRGVVAARFAVLLGFQVQSIPSDTTGERLSFFV